jgi:hypothetical protein
MIRGGDIIIIVHSNRGGGLKVMAFQEQILSSGAHVPRCEGYGKREGERACSLYWQHAS